MQGLIFLSSCRISSWKKHQRIKISKLSIREMWGYMTVKRVRVLCGILFDNCIQIEWIYRFWHLPSEVGGILRITHSSVHFSCLLLCSDLRKQWACYSVFPSSQLETLTFWLKLWKSQLSFCTWQSALCSLCQPHCAGGAQQTGRETLKSEQHNEFLYISLDLTFLTILKTCYTAELRGKFSLPRHSFPAPKMADWPLVLVRAGTELWLS